MAGSTTNAELVAEVKQLRHRLGKFEQQRIDSAHDSLSNATEDAEEKSYDPNWLNQLYKDAPVGLCFFDTQLRYRNVNEWLATLNGLKAEDHLGRTLSELFPEWAIKIEPLLRQVIETGEPIHEVSISLETPAQQDALRCFHYNFTAAKSVEGHVVGVSCAVMEIKQQKRAESLLEGEKKVLEAISSLNSHDGGLTELVEFIESQSDGVICSILLMDDDGLHLRHGAAKNLPEECNRVIDGMAIGPCAGSCGTAAYLNQAVIVTDITSDPLWVNFRDLGMKHGIRACWSIPIRSAAGHVLGTFAMYHSEPRSPDEFHLMLTERAVHLASIAIEQKKAEAALLESNDRFRTIFESVPECVKLLDKDGNLLDMNAAGLSMIEADSIEQVRGESVHCLIAPEHRDTFLTNGTKVFEGESNSQEFEIIGLQGTRRWVETHQVPLRDVDGNTTSLLAVAHDVTERKRIEDAQRASEIWFRSIFEQVGVAVGVFESNSGKIVSVNSKYANLIGYSSAELIGKTWMELTHPEDIPLDQHRIDELNENLIRDFSIEKRLIHKNGSLIWIKLTVSAMWQPGEAPGQQIGIIEDITARKSAEAEILSRAQQQAIVADLGQRALSGADPSELFDMSVSVITTVLDAEYAKVLKLLPDGKSLIFRAMEGWDEQKLQGHVIPIQSRSQAAATLRSGEPIVVEDMHADERFDVTQSLSDHKIVSGVTVIISGQDRLFGVLGVHSCKRREFTQHDISFLQAIANILGEAIDRKHAELALKESEHRLRLVTDAMPAFISYTGINQCYEFVNQCYESTFGRKRSEIVGKTVWDIFGTDYYESIKPHLESALAGNPVKYERVAEFKQGGKRTLSTEHVPDRTPDGIVRGYYTLAVDITERKEIEDELNTIFDMSLDLICVANIETATYVKVNRSFLQVLGYSEAELLGRTFLDFVHPDDIKPTIDVIEKELKQGKKVMRFQNRFQTKSGDYRWLDWSSNPNVTSGLSYNIAHDITELKFAEEQAWKQRDELAHMSRISTMGEMATGIAHELNQPLTAIASYSYAAGNIISQLNLSQTDIQDILDELEDQAIRAGDIVRRLRNFVKKTESVRVATDLNVLIKDVAKFVEPDRRQSETKLEFQFFEPSPTVLVDEIQIQQVLVNLIRNAIDSMLKIPGSQRRVTVSTRILQDRQAEVSVSDSGTGLSHEEFQLVFDAFFSTKQEGMGMGLPISRSIVEAHGGKLIAEMNPLSGMTFKFTIPLEDKK